MLDTVGTVVAYLVAMGLVAAPFWWVSAMWTRRCVGAATRAAAELDGRYEPAGSRRFSGGTIHGRTGARDIVVDFFTGHSAKPARTTTAMTIVKEPRTGKLVVRRTLLGGWDGADRLPADGSNLLARLEAFRHARIEAWSNMLTVRVGGVLHDAGRIVELASITAALASELERRPGSPPGSRFAP
jgi:hypothetical protein